MSATWDDEYLTVKEIAEHLKLNQQTVRNWIDEGSCRRCGSVGVFEFGASTWIASLPKAPQSLPSRRHPRSNQVTRASS